MVKSDETNSTKKEGSARYGGSHRFLNTVGKRIAASFAVIVLVVVAATATKIWELTHIAEATTRIQQLRSPTTLAALTAINGLNRSQAALQEWMLHGEGVARNARSKAWSDEIWPAMDKMHILSRKWTDRKSMDRLDLVTTRLKELEAVQSEVEGVIHQARNTPATQLFDREAAPLIERVWKEIDDMINVEKEQPASTERRDLFAALSDFRSSLDLLHIRLHTYLDSGNDSASEAFTSSLQTSETAFKTVERQSRLFTSEQRRLFGALAKAWGRLLPLLPRISAIRAGDDSNVALYTFRTRAIPAAAEANRLLNGVLEDQQAFMQTDLESSNRRTWALLAMLLVLNSIVILTSIWAGWRLTRSVNVPLHNAVVAANGLAVGDLRGKIAPSGLKELDELAQAIESVSEELRGVSAQAEHIAQGDYDVVVEPRSEKDELAENLVRMTDSLRRLKATNEKQLWLATSRSELGIILVGNHTTEELSDAILEYLCRRVDAQVGALYVADGGTLTLTGSYAYTGADEPPSVLKIGEGLVGQAAASKRIVVTDDVPEGYLRIASALGETRPAQIAVVPLANEDEIVAVLELGTFERFSEAARELLEVSSGKMTTAIQSTLFKQDLAARRAELEESEERVRSIIETAADGIILIDDWGVIQSVNPSAENLFGYTREELVDESVSILMPAPYKEEHQSYLANYRRTGIRRISEKGRELVAQHKDGTTFPIRLTLGEMRLGERHLFSGFIRDITEEKRASEEIESQNEELQSQQEELQAQQEELRQTNVELEMQAERLLQSERELQQANEELEERMNEISDQKSEIEQKTHELELAREDLQKKLEELALTSKYKSEFLANMSHELRTPLNSLLILARQLANNREGNLTEKQVEFAEVILESGTDLLTLIEEILDLARIEAGRTDILPGEVNLEELCNSLERTFRPLSEKKSVDFSIDAAEDLPAAIVTDEKRLEQILRNLLSNSFKFTPEGEVSLTIGVQRDNTWGTDHPRLIEAAAVISFRVSDSGIGIAAEELARIFQPFEQGETGTKRRFGGSGLGLSISRDLAWLLGGEIHVESTPGEGSSFTLYLPDRYTAPSPTESEAAPDVEEEIGHATLAVPENIEESLPQFEDDRDDLLPGDPVVVIIEDDARFAAILRDQVREKGFKSIVSTLGLPGIALVRKLQPAAVTLDIRLPDCDGWTVLDTLKHDPETRHIPVHIISVESDVRRGLRLGAMTYLRKPVEIESISRALDRIKEHAEREVRRLLVVEDDGIQREAIVDLLDGPDVEIVAVTTGSEAVAAIEDTMFDCVVLDLHLPDMSGVELMKDIKEKPGYHWLPFVVYTITDLTKSEEKQLRRFAETVIVKGAGSEERLFDETALFLRRIESSLDHAKHPLPLVPGKNYSELEGKTILVVDDDPRNLFAVTTLLEGCRMKVIGAESGDEALRQLAGTDGNGIDIVLMDIMMPEMDGYEVMRKIRRKSKHRALPIIALTAKAMKGDREASIDAGASDYISKPLDSDQLLSLLRVWLGS